MRLKIRQSGNCLVVVNSALEILPVVVIFMFLIFSVPGAWWLWTLLQNLQAIHNNENLGGANSGQILVLIPTAVCFIGVGIAVFFAPIPFEYTFDKELGQICIEERNFFGTRKYRKYSTSQIVEVKEERGYEVGDRRLKLRLASGKRILLLEETVLTDKDEAEWNNLIQLIRAAVNV